ncbi:hypothetical protein [Glycomyces sp. NPDC047010]|uniref:hypothetical protein n=1 Tax=Glycomyces sp. NPDC047010 TaxID=3155023 RepID=UPI0034065F98
MNASKPVFPGTVRIEEPHDGEKLLGLVGDLITHQGFDPNDFLIVGSARLYVTGHRTHLSDIDLLARGETWRRALREVELGRGHDEKAVASGDKVLRLCGGLVEVFDRWVMPGTSADELIDNPEIMRGLPFMQLEELVRYKRYLNRSKDRADLRALSRFSHNPI